MLLLVGVMVALLALLATLQYRWLGQVSAGERERMQASVSAGAARFSQDFNREITRAYLSFQVESETLREKGDAEYAARFEQWDAKAPYPKLVGDVFLFERDEHDTLRLRRFNRELKKFEAVEWPADFARLRARLEQGLAQDKNPEVEQEISLDPVEADVPALVAPVIKAPRVAPDERDVQIFKGEDALQRIPDFSPLTGYLIVRLDQDVIRNEMLPALARQYFSGGDGLEYNLTVINPQEPDKPVYQSAQTGQAQPKGDATARLLDVQLDQLDTLFFGLPRRPLPAKERATFFTQKLPPGEVIMRSNEQTHSRNSNGRSVTVRVFNREMQESATLERTAAVGAGPWQLLIQHRAGSLEAAVTNARRRSLAISFGILLLLAGSVTMIVISTRRAERLAHRQMEFVSAVSHEFRTPLAVICSAGENLADGIVDAPQQVAKYGELVRNEGRRLTEMVEQVLEFAGARSGRRAYQMRPVAVESIIEDSLVSYQPLLKEQGYVVEKNIEGDLPPVLADAAALRRSLQNLLSNAMKYDGGNRWIGIRAQAAVKEQGEEVQLTVEDQGIGIAPDEAANVFEPFYRGREVVEAQIHGNGLGLSLVRQVIEAHHGRVTLVSAPGQGSAFTLHLPALNHAENGDGASAL